MEPFLAFLAVAAVAMLVPGPDTFVVMRTALADGARAGTWAAAGSATGNVVWGAASAVGVAALLAASGAAFSALKLAGAAYLVFVGVQALRAAARGDSLAGGDERRGLGAAFRRGLTSDLLNVKVGLFWTALVPQFVAADSSAVLPVAMVVAMGVDGLRLADRLRAPRRAAQPDAAAATQLTGRQRDRRRRPPRARGRPRDSLSRRGP